MKNIVPFCFFVFLTYSCFLKNKERDVSKTLFFINPKDSLELIENSFKSEFKGKYFSKRILDTLVNVVILNEDLGVANVSYYIKLRKQGERILESILNNADSILLLFPNFCVVKKNNELFFCVYSYSNKKTNFIFCLKNLFIYEDKTYVINYLENEIRNSNGDNIESIKNVLKMVYPIVVKIKETALEPPTVSYSKKQK
jgi:sulfur transfer complex TusBCD TusB component (DsrH family)